MQKLITLADSWSHMRCLFLWFQKNGHSFIKAEDPDIFCLQETKCNVAKLPDVMKNVAGYKTYWLSGDKEGYSGTALFSKQEPITVSYGISKVFSLLSHARSSVIHDKVCHPAFAFELCVFFWRM